MQVTAMLCNHAEAQNNLLYISGAGITQSVVPQGMPAPYGISLALGVLIEIPWQATNHHHHLSITLIDADGQQVMVPTGEDASQPLAVEADFNIGRPPGLVAGEDQPMAFAVNFPNVPMPKLGDYRFVISIDGNAEREIKYKIATLQGTMGFSPTSVGPF